MRQPFVAATGRCDRKTASARPIDQIANKRRLVAESQRINQTSISRLASQQRAAKRIGFHGDIHHVFAMGERRQAMLYRSNRVAGAFDHHIDQGVGHQRLPVLG